MALCTRCQTNELPERRPGTRGPKPSLCIECRKGRRGDPVPRDLPCETCGEPFVRPARGAPARNCPSCRSEVIRAQARARHRRDNPNAGTRKFRLRVIQWMPRASRPVRIICGCGRDYASVPLEEADEICPNPIVVS